MAKEITYKPKTSLALKTLLNLGLAHNDVLDKTYGYIKTTGLTPSQFAIIEILAHNGGLKISEVYAHMLIKSGNKTLIFDTLEKKNLVRRVYSKSDRREIIIELTANGQKFFDQHYKEYASTVEKAFSVLSQAEQKNLSVLLNKLYETE